MESKRTRSTFILYVAQSSPRKGVDQLIRLTIGKQSSAINYIVTFD